MLSIELQHPFNNAILGLYHRRTGQAFGGRAGPYFAQIRMMKIPEKDKSTGKLPKYLANFARI